MWWKPKKKWWWNVTESGSRETFIGYDATEVRAKLQNRDVENCTYTLSIHDDGSITIDTIYSRPLGQYVMDPDMSVRWVPDHFTS